MKVECLAMLRKIFNKYVVQPLMRNALKKGIARELSKERPIFKAVYDGNLNEVTQLLQREEDPGTLGKAGMSLLHIAAAGGHEKIVKKLLDAGSNLDQQDAIWGMPPLSIAVFAGKVDVVSVLLDRGADPDTKDNEGRSPLDYAKMSAEPKVKTLIETALKGTGQKNIKDNTPGKNFS